MKYPAALVAAVVACLSLSNCGDGGSNDDNPTTIRPKTLDGIVLSLDNAAQFEFVRNAGTPAAVKSGDVETGTFRYTPLISSNVLRFYDNLNGDRSNTRYPDSIFGATYSYRAINESSGVLTMTGNGSFGVVVDASNIVLNNSWIRLFYTASPGTNLATDETHVVEVAVSFTASAGFISSDTVTLRLPESAFVDSLDTIRIPSTISLAAGGAVPENYLPEIDPNAPGKIVPATLSNTLLNATNGIPDATKDFTLQFVADASGVNGLPGEPEEIGQVIVSVYDPTLAIPGLRAMSVAANYTWRRIGGTDIGQLVLSNVPDEATLPFDTTLNGSYLVDFSGFQTGLYTGSVDADTLDAAEVSGSFTLLNGD